MDKLKNKFWITYPTSVGSSSLKKVKDAIGKKKDVIMAENQKGNFLNATDDELEILEHSVQILKMPHKTDGKWNGFAAKFDEKYSKECYIIAPSYPVLTKGDAYINKIPIFKKVINAGNTKISDKTDSEQFKKAYKEELRKKYIPALTLLQNKLQEKDENTLISISFPGTGFFGGVFQKQKWFEEFVTQAFLEIVDEFGDKLPNIKGIMVYDYEKILSGYKFNSKKPVIVSSPPNIAPMSKIEDVYELFPKSSGIENKDLILTKIVGGDKYSYIGNEGLVDLPVSDEAASIMATDQATIKAIKENFKDIIQNDGAYLGASLKPIEKKEPKKALPAFVKGKGINNRSIFRFLRGHSKNIIDNSNDDNFGTEKEHYKHKGIFRQIFYKDRSENPFASVPFFRGFEWINKSKGDKNPRVKYDNYDLKLDGIDFGDKPNPVPYDNSNIKKSNVKSAGGIIAVTPEGRVAMHHIKDNSSKEHNGYRGARIDFPAESQESDETAAKAAERAAKEEVGLEVVLDKDIGGSHDGVQYFLAGIKGGKPWEWNTDSKKGFACVNETSATEFAPLSQAKDKFAYNSNDGYSNKNITAYDALKKTLDEEFNLARKNIDSSKVRTGRWDDGNFVADEKDREKLSELQKIIKKCQYKYDLSYQDICELFIKAGKWGGVGNAPPEAGFTQAQIDFSRDFQEKCMKNAVITPVETSQVGFRTKRLQTLFEDENEMKRWLYYAGAYYQMNNVKKEEPKVMVFDIDGTLNEHGGAGNFENYKFPSVVQTKMKECYEYCQKKGHYFAIYTNNNGVSEHHQEMVAKILGDVDIPSSKITVTEGNGKNCEQFISEADYKGHLQSGMVNFIVPDSGNIGNNSHHDSSYWAAKHKILERIADSQGIKRENINLFEDNARLKDKTGDIKLKLTNSGFAGTADNIDETKEQIKLENRRAKGKNDDGFYIGR